LFVDTLLARLFVDLRLGKTELIRFLARLLNQVSSPFMFYEGFTPPSNDQIDSNFFVLRCNGGTSVRDIETIVTQANEFAMRGAVSILFLDELNTAPHISLFKEIISDRRCFGQALHKDLRIVGAVNPYQLHSKATIDRLSQAGLGYSVKNDDLGEKTQCIGSVPLRNLVYRVHPLCDALKQLVWEVRLCVTTA
jgi:hypothetical protein